MAPITTRREHNNEGDEGYGCVHLRGDGGAIHHVGALGVPARPGGKGPT